VASDVLAAIVTFLLFFFARAGARSDGRHPSVSGYVTIDGFLHWRSQCGVRDVMMMSVAERHLKSAAAVNGA